MQGKTMNKLTRTLILATAAFATVATSVEIANARGPYPYWRNHRHFYGRNALAAGVVGLTAGVIVGSAMARPRVIYRPAPVVVDQEEPVYTEPNRVYVEPGDQVEGPVDSYDSPDDNSVDNGPSDDGYFPDAPRQTQTYQRQTYQTQTYQRQVDQHTVQGNLEPWTAEWRSWCAQTYHSFNPRTGTYRGYDSREHFCTAG
jgi:hypothetical protein